MLDVLMDHLALGIGDCAFDGVELLRQFKAALAMRKHLYRRAKMPFRALEPFYDVGVAGMFGVAGMLHDSPITLSSPPGYS